MQIQSRHRVASILLVMVIAMTMMFTVQTRSASAKTAYWLKVNTQRCVVTAYKKTGGTWKPVRAMLCSPGKSGTSTVHGTFRIGIKKRWGALNGGLWGSIHRRLHGTICFTPSGTLPGAALHSQQRNSTNSDIRPATDVSGCPRLMRNGFMTTVPEGRK